MKIYKKCDICGGKQLYWEGNAINFIRYYVYPRIMVCFYKLFGKCVLCEKRIHLQFWFTSDLLWNLNKFSAYGHSKIIKDFIDYLYL